MRPSNIGEVSVTLAPWQRWSETPAQPEGTIRYEPRTVADLVAITQMLRTMSPADHRASGSRWSSSNAARPSGATWTDTDRLDTILAINLQDLADDARSDPAALVLVQSGIKLHALAEALWAARLSLPTLGGALGQSLAGAISTSTHGSDIGLPSVAGMVRAIHLVSPSGQEFWLEHPDRPIASADSLASRYPDWHPSMRVLRAADPFNSALVCAGRCGFVYAYVLEVVPRFKLRGERQPMPWPEVREALRQAAIADDWAEGLRRRLRDFDDAVFFDVALNPGNPRGMAWVGRRSRVPLATPDDLEDGQSYATQAQLLDAASVGNDVGGAVLGGIFGFLIGGPAGAVAGATAGAGAQHLASDEIWRIITDIVFSDQLGGPPQIGRNYQISAGRATPYASYEERYDAFWDQSPKASYIEVSFDAQSTDYLDYIDDLIELMASLGSGLSGFVSIRFCAGSDAPLAMQRWPVTASVEVVLLEQFGSPRTFIQRVLQDSLSYDCRFHLGMTSPNWSYGDGFRQDVESWNRGAARLGVRSGDSFSTASSRALGLEPNRGTRDTLLFLASA